MSQGFTDQRDEHLKGERFYIDQGEIHRRLNVERRGTYYRRALDTFFEHSISERLLPQKDTDFSYYLKDMWEAEAKVKLENDQDEQWTEVPADLVKILKEEKDPRFSFRLTWEKRDICYSNSLGIVRKRADHTRVLRVDYQSEGLHLRRFVYHPSAELAQKRIDSMKQLLLNFEKDRFEDVDSGKHSVILDPSLSAVLAHEIFGHVAERIKMPWELKVAQAKPISPKISVWDKAHIYPTGSSYSFDDEGFTPKDIHIVDKGSYQNAIATVESAFRLDQKPFGRARAQDFRYRPLSRMSNILIGGGDSSLHDMFSELQDGFYFLGALGGAMTGSMFQIQAQHGYRIAGGKLKSYVRGALLYGLLDNVMKNITHIGSKEEWVADGGCFAGGQFMNLSGRGAPHLLIRDMFLA